LTDFLKSKNNFYFFGILLGIGNYLTSFVELSKPLPVITLIALISFGLNLLFRRGNERIPSILLFLVPFGIFLSLARYFLLYSSEGMVLTPILRHSASLTLGLILLSIFIQIFKSLDFLEISKGVVAGSLLPLTLGLIQFFSNHLVGGSLRIQSFFTEPSYYGEYLVLLVIPCIAKISLNFSKEHTLARFGLIIVTVILLLNLIFTQSGTVILRLVTLLILFVIIFPISKKIKLSAIMTICCLILVTSLFQKSYVYGRIQNAYDILITPNHFFKYHTYYDRFYPFFAAFKTMPDYFFIGTGFGGDYYEFKNLYPIEVQPELFSRNPNLSYFFSFGPKLILYFGLIAMYVYYYLFQRGKECHDKLIMISFFAVLVSSFWSISNFSLPYIWFWLALILVGQRKSQTEENKNEKILGIIPG